MLGDGYINASEMFQRNQYNAFLQDLSDMKEGYFVYRDKTMDKVHVHTINTLRFDNYITMNETYSLTGDFEMSTLTDMACVHNCGELLTEYKQITEYENEITELKSKLEKITKHRNKLWSENLCIKSARGYLQDESDIINARLANKWFAIWLDIYSSGTNLNVIVVPIDKDEFLNTDYGKMFTLDTTFDYRTFYLPPFVTHDKMGVNHWFIVCDADSYQHAIDSLVEFESHQVIKGTEEYMYNRLNDIWKLTYGKEHEGSD